MPHALKSRRIRKVDGSRRHARCRAAAKEPVAVQVRAAAWAWAEVQEPVAEQAQRA